MKSKILVLSLLLSTIILSCQKENLLITPIAQNKIDVLKSFYNSQRVTVNNRNFLNLTPKWETVTEQFINGEKIIEVDVSNPENVIFGQRPEGNQSTIPQVKLILKLDAVNDSIMSSMFMFQVNNGSSVTNLSHSKLEDFTGTVLYFDLKGDLMHGVGYIKGVNFKKISPIKSDFSPSFEKRVSFDNSRGEKLAYMQPNLYCYPSAVQSYRTACHGAYYEGQYTGDTCQQYFTGWIDVQVCFEEEQIDWENVNTGGGPPQGGPGMNPYLDLDCQAGYDDEMESILENREPRWGQLGNKQSILNDLNQGLLGVNGNFKSSLETLSNYFNINRLFSTDAQNNITELSHSVKRDRYVYSYTRGWIDMHHFFVAAYLAEDRTPFTAFEWTTAAELIQAISISHSASAFSYEDLPSNKAGIDFFLQYGVNIKQGNLTLESALNSFFTSIQVTDPQNAPNFDVIPHAISDQVPKNFTTKGLTGQTLKQSALNSFCDKSDQLRNNIINAHKKIPHTSKL